MQARAIYNIVELTLYTPLTIGTISVVRRHEDVTKSAWTVLLLFGLTRIAAASTSFADTFEPSRSLRVAGAVMDSVGLAALLYTPMILTTRINAIMWQQKAPQRYFWLTIFPLIIAFVVGLIGSLNVTSSDQGNVSKGWVRLQVAGAFFLIEVILLMAVAAFNTLRYSHVPKSEVRLLYSVAVGATASLLPSLFTLIAAALKQSRYYWTPSLDLGLILSAILKTGPETLAFVMYLWAGFTVQLPKVVADVDAEEAPPAYAEPLPETIEAPSVTTPQADRSRVKPKLTKK